MYKRCRRYFGFFAFSAMFFACLAARAREYTPDPRAYGPDEKVEGKTLAEWTAVWWQWILPIKKEKNPCTDKTGAFAREGQSGPVFFLAGNTGGKTERACKLPAGKPVLIPILNTVENAPPDKADEKKLQAGAAMAMDRATGPEITRNGKPIKVTAAQRVVSPTFSFTGPDKPQDALSSDVTGKQVGVSDGYWIILKPLSMGDHTLRFKGRLKSEKKEEQFDLDVSYRLTVAAEK